MTNLPPSVHPVSKILRSAPPEAYGPPPQERSRPLRKKDGFEPAVQRWSALLPDGEDELVVGFFGVQVPLGTARPPADARSESSAAAAADAVTNSPLLEWVDTVLRTHPAGPTTLDHAQYIDSASGLNHVVTAYWLSKERYAQWAADTAASEAFWTDPARVTDATPTGRPRGVWREVLQVPTSHFESIFWLDYPGGMSGDAAVRLYPTPYCGYYGAMRDRLPVAAHDPLDADPDSEHTSFSEFEEGGRGARWRVRVPANVAIIRSAHTWELMDAEQKADYDEKLAPPLAKGMEYLQTPAGAAAGCLSLRWHVTTDARGQETTEKHATGYFASLAHMEAWAERHGSHAAIFGAAVRRYRHYGSANQLRTWHEVYVLPEGREDEQLFEYINCARGTGVLGCFEAEQMPRRG